MINFQERWRRLFASNEFSSRDWSNDDHNLNKHHWETKLCRRTRIFNSFLSFFSSFIFLSNKIKRSCGRSSWTMAPKPLFDVQSLSILINWLDDHIEKVEDVHDEIFDADVCYQWRWAAVLRGHAESTERLEFKIKDSHFFMERLWTDKNTKRIFSFVR